MILSRTAVYAVKAVLHLAEADERPVRVDDIARALNVPRNYLSKILHALARDGVLDSTRGPRGGFALARDAGEILLSDVIDPFDEVSSRSGCLLGRAECTDSNPCAAHARWKDVSSAVRSFFRETTVWDLSMHGSPVPEAASPHDRP
ncbi:MAG TPA: Rrf2 family transcriptional regulator [Longimicrobiales bacterium]